MDSRTLAALFAAYTLGCVNAGYYLVRARTGQDIRRTGSGVTGATNVGRLLGRSGCAVTFALDFVKGVAAVALSLALGAPPLPAAVAAVAGHVWPVQLGFRGGKGVAPALGALLVLDPWSIPLLVALFLPAFAALRRFELAGLAAFALLPAIWLLAGKPVPSTLGLALVVILVLVAHRANLKEEWDRRRSRTPDRS